MNSITQLTMPKKLINARLSCGNKIILYPALEQSAREIEKKRKSNMRDKENVDEERKQLSSRIKRAKIELEDLKAYLSNLSRKFPPVLSECILVNLNEIPNKSQIQKWDFETNVYRNRYDIDLKLSKEYEEQIKILKKKTIVDVDKRALGLCKRIAIFKRKLSASKRKREASEAKLKIIKKQQDLLRKELENINWTYKCILRKQDKNNDILAELSAKNKCYMNLRRQKVTEIELLNSNKSQDEKLFKNKLKSIHEEVKLITDKPIEFNTKKSDLMQKQNEKSSKKITCGQPEIKPLKIKFKFDEFKMFYEKQIQLKAPKEKIEEIINYIEEDNDAKEENEINPSQNPLDTDENNSREDLGDMSIQSEEKINELEEKPIRETENITDLDDLLKVLNEYELIHDRNRIKIHELDKKINKIKTKPLELPLNEIEELKKQITSNNEQIERLSKVVPLLYKERNQTVNLFKNIIRKIEKIFLQTKLLNKEQSFLENNPDANPRFEEVKVNAKNIFAFMEEILKNLGTSYRALEDSNYVNKDLLEGNIQLRHFIEPMADLYFRTIASKTTEGKECDIYGYLTHTTHKKCR